MQARQALVDSPRTILKPSQRADFLDIHKTNTNLVAFVLEMIGKGHVMQFTAVRSDHHDDSALSPAPHAGTHAGGYACDCWPLSSSRANSWLVSSSPAFQEFLRDAAASPWLKQIGLAGTAVNYLNELAAGHTVFVDSGQDHIHFGVHA